MPTKKIIIKKPQPKELLTPAERGLHAYMLDARDSRGLYNLFDGEAAKQFAATSRLTIQRIRTALIRKEAVEVVKVSYRGSDGWLVPPVLRPLEPSSLMNKGLIPSSPMNKAALSTAESTRGNELGDVVEKTKTILVHSSNNPSSDEQQKLNTVYSPLSLSVKNVGQSIKTVTVGPDKVNLVPRSLTALERVRIRQQQEADAIDAAERAGSPCQS
jgi:hypothetical protein